MNSLGHSSTSKKNEKMWRQNYILLHIVHILCAGRGRRFSFFKKKWTSPREREKKAPSETDKDIFKWFFTWIHFDQVQMSLMQPFHEAERLFCLFVLFFVVHRHVSSALLLSPAVLLPHLLIALRDEKETHFMVKS